MFFENKEFEVKSITASFKLTKRLQLNQWVWHLQADGQWHLQMGWHRCAQNAGLCCKCSLTAAISTCSHQDRSFSPATAWWSDGKLERILRPWISTARWIRIFLGASTNWLIYNQNQRNLSN